MAVVDRLWEVQSFIHLIQVVYARNEKLLPYTDVLQILKPVAFSSLDFTK